MQGGSGTISAVARGASTSSSLSAQPAGGTVYDVESRGVYGSNQPSTLSSVLITKSTAGYEYLVGLTSDNFLWRMTTQSGEWVKVANEATGIAAADGLAVYIRNGLVLDASTGNVYGNSQPGTFSRTVVTTDAAGYKYLLGLTSDNFLWRMTTQSGVWVKVANEVTGIAAADGLAVYIRNGLVLDASTGGVYGTSQSGTLNEVAVTTDSAGYKRLVARTSDSYVWSMSTQSGAWERIAGNAPTVAAGSGLAVYTQSSSSC